MRHMKTIILCGGKGTRLREFTEKIPKPLIEVGGKPVIWHLMQYYSHFNFSDFILCAGYLQEKFTEYFRMNTEFQNVISVDTGIETTKSERIRIVYPYIPSGEDFFVSYGDDLSDVPLHSLLEFHKRHGKIATLVAIRPRSQYGILALNGPLVAGFIEKPVLEHWINGGFYIFKYEIFNYLQCGELENDVLPLLARKGEVVAYQHKGFWKSMNTFQDVVELNELYSNGKAAWKLWDPHYERAILAK